MKTKLYLIGTILLCLIFFVSLILTLNNNGRLKKDLIEVRKEYEALLNAPKDTVYKTETDTFTFIKPVYITRTEVVTDSIHIHDTIKDIEVVVPREQLTYSAEEYHAVVSGYRPSLDTIQVYQKTVTEIVTREVVKTKNRRWGVGLGVGAGYDGKKVRPMVYGGIQYNILAF